MANPRDLERVFVVRDFATEGLEQALQNLIRRPGRDYELRAPGVVGEGGEILRDVVLPGIMEASRVLVFVDRPNANVGFEAGLAIGLGKPTALVQVGDERQLWLEHPPIINTLVHRLTGLSDLHRLVEDEAIWRQAPLRPLRRNTRGRAPTTKFLCPGGTEGARYLRLQQDSQPFWQRPPQENFTLRDLPWFFADAFQAVWVIAQPEEADAERDGIGNACNAVMAGWFCAQLLTGDTDGGFVEGAIRDRWGAVKRGLRVLRSTLCRPIRDVEILEHTFDGLGDFSTHLQQIPIADLRTDIGVRPLWLLKDRAQRPLPEMLREQVDRMQARAVELTAGGEFDRALDELRAGDELSASLVLEWPDDVGLKLSRAYLLKTLNQVLVHSGNADLASHAADRAVKGFQDAVQQGATASVSKVELAEAINGLGNMLQSQGKLESAIVCYRQATKLFPQYAAAWHDLYGAYVQLRATTDVDVRILRDAFDRMKEHGQRQPGLSSLYIASLEKRLTVLERPMGAEEKMFSADAPELAQAFVAEIVRRDDALGNFLRSQDLLPDVTNMPWPSIEAAERALQEGNTMEARATLEQILSDAKPANADERDALARAATMTALLVTASDPDRARALVDAAATATPRLPKTWYEMGSVRQRLGDAAGAVAAFKRHVVLAAQQGDYRSFVHGLTDLALSSWENGDSRAAEHSFRMAVGIANALGDHRLCARQCLYLARYYNSSEYDDQARMGVAFAQKALQLYEGLSNERCRADASRYLALGLERVGDPREAERWSREALRIYEKLGLRTEATVQTWQLARLLVEHARSEEAVEVLRTGQNSCSDVGLDETASRYDKWLRKELPQLLERDRRVEETRMVLREFDAHLRSLGLDWQGEFPSVRIVDNDYFLGCYDPKRNVMLIGTHAIGDTDIALKEYVYRALHTPLFETRHHVAREIARVATAGAGFTLGALLSGVATYFACSYGNDSGFARRSARSFGVPPLVDLERQQSMDEVASVPTFGDLNRRVCAVQEAGAVWGSALWAIRREIGRPQADRLVASAWRAALESPDDAGIASSFARALVDQSSSDSGRESARRHFEARGITIVAAC
jgi:tetratricopeptide (TPR) repeat protein